MSNTPQHGWSQRESNEIIQDLVFVKFMLEVIKRMKDLEAKHYLSMILKLLTPIIVYEVADSLEIMGIKKKSDFFSNSAMAKRVKKERDRAVKEIIVKSSHVEETQKAMGLKFSPNVYDMQIVMSNNRLLGMNFEDFHDRVTDQDFWDSLFMVAKEMLNAFLLAGGSSMKIDEIFSCLDADLKTFSVLADRQLSGKRYKYSSCRLFCHADDLKVADKIFILYRYRMLSSVFELDAMLPRKNVRLNNDPPIDIYNFLRKYKALLIDILGRELRCYHSPFMDRINEEIESRISTISNKRFFRFNRKLRDNIHYSKTECLNDEEIQVIDKYQKVYFDIIRRHMESVIFVEANLNYRTLEFLGKVVHRFSGFLSSVLKHGSR